MKKEKNVKGITLIALVITIIVLLILAGITIATLMGENGILTRANMASVVQIEGQVDEEVRLAVQSVKLYSEQMSTKNAGWYASNNIGDTNNEKEYNDLDSGERVTIIGQLRYDLTVEKGYKIISNEGSSKIKVLYETDAYKKATNDTNATIEKIISIDDNAFYIGEIPIGTGKLLKAKARPGDYVKYTPTAKTFSMTTEKTGQADTQNFDTEDYEGLWQVLYNDDTHGLQIISAGSVGTLKFGGKSVDESKVAYNEIVNTLNDFSKNYVNVAYAKDANSGRCVGSDPINPIDVTEEYFNYEYMHGFGEEGQGCKEVDNKWSLDCEAMEKAISQIPTGIQDIDSEYWLASRNNKYRASGSVFFYLRKVDTDGVMVDSQQIVYSYACAGPFCNNISAGVRPVITLNSEIKTNVGDGSSLRPFELMPVE